MTGHISGVATRFHQFIRICCGAHQVDIILQEVDTDFGKNEFYGKLTAAISYLC